MRNEKKNRENGDNIQFSSLVFHFFFRIDINNPSGLTARNRLLDEELQIRFRIIENWVKKGFGRFIVPTPTYWMKSSGLVLWKTKNIASQIAQIYGTDKGIICKRLNMYGYFGMPLTSTHTIFFFSFTFLLSSMLSFCLSIPLRAPLLRLPMGFVGRTRPWMSFVEWAMSIDGGVKLATQ